MTKRGGSPDGDLPRAVLASAASASAEKPAVVARGLSKAYRGRGLSSLLGRRSTGWTHHPTDERLALREVSFTLPRGAAIGVIGRNGAGKSTLLRILAGISQPTAGSVRTSGSLRGLLELGGEMIEELSGYENGRAALVLAGVTRRELEERLRSVEQFAELGLFFHQPVRVYSAGMRLRLAYALAVAVRPEILIVDEILAVGDESFQRKCSHHIMQFLSNGGTMVLASHNLFHVEKLCRTALWLDGGKVAAHGAARDVTAHYRASIEATNGSRKNASERSGNGARITILVPDASSEQEPVALMGKPLEIAVELLEGFLPPAMLEIIRPDGTIVARLKSKVAERCRIRVASWPLLPGRYSVRLRGETGYAPEPVLAEQWFDCRGESRELGTVRLAHAWG